jgi:hypothetical protein
MGVKVHFIANMLLKSKKEHFLSNTENKQNFIDLLSEKMHTDGIRILHAVGDADLLIAKTGIEHTTKGITQVILLCHHAKQCTSGLFYRSEKATTKYPVWNFCLLRQMLGGELCHALPFKHAICGCDTTSRLFCIGKGSDLKRAQNDKLFMQQAQVFCSDASVGDIQKAGENHWCLFMGAPVSIV